MTPSEVDLKFQHESNPCSGGHPDMVSLVAKHGHDEIVASWYASSRGIVDPLPSIFVRRNGKLFDLLKGKLKDELSVSSIQMELHAHRAYNEFLRDNPLCCTSVVEVTMKVTVHHSHDINPLQVINDSECYWQNPIDPTIGHIAQDSIEELKLA